MTVDTLPAAAEARTVTTRTGIVLDVRPIRPDDEAALAEFFDRVTDEDRRFRFLTSYRHLTHDQLARLTEVDHWATESLLATDKATGQVVASAMLACDKDMQGGEIAVSVCAAYRGKGVGWAMLDVLADEARRRGLKRVVSIEDRDNHGAIDLERERGFRPRAVEDDPHLVMLEKTFD